MGWLNSWLRQLITIVLIAGFVELLLPAQAMQRYVRTVIGLFLLMVMLTPVFELFQRRWSPEQMIAAAEAGMSKAQTGHYQTLAEVMQQASKLQLRNQQDAQQILETSLAGAIRSGMEQQLHERVDRIQVKTKLDDHGSPSIDSVDVIVFDKQSPPAEADGGKELVPPFKPVAVDIKPVKPDEAVPVTGTNGNSGDRERLDSIRQYVSKEWQTKPEHITITIH